MSELDQRFHETWLGLVQPTQGLVVSVPVLVDAQCMQRQPIETQTKLSELCPPTASSEDASPAFAIRDLDQLFVDLLGYAPEMFDRQSPLSLYVPEGKQTLKPTLALRDGDNAYAMLVWDIPLGVELDKPETVTGTWDYPAAAKFERLLRHAGVAIGLLTNREVVRLIYAPHGESSGSIDFRIADMRTVGGRPILDAFVMLLAANRFFGVEKERALPEILHGSRLRQANVTSDLAEQVFSALEVLLRGFEIAAERDGGDLLSDAVVREGDHLYRGLLTVLLRVVFVLYAEDRGLLPIEHPLYARHYSLLALYERLLADRGAHPDAMSQRFGAYGHMVALFRAIFLGAAHAEFHMPPRRGSLFNPHTYPFLEGWGPGGSAPITQTDARAHVNVPSVDDGTVLSVLEKLIVFEGQRLSYRALDVEQIGSIYEALMGYHVVRIEHASVRIRDVWIAPEDIAAIPSAQRGKWLKEELGLSGAAAEKLAKDFASDASITALEKHAKKVLGPRSIGAGRLVLQPGNERRRTSSHYTPRSLSAPIVRRTLEPLLNVMGDAPSSARILDLKVCDPAMGSGAFLVEACRFLADHVVAAWARENAIEGIAQEHGDPLLFARRLVAQKCLYGVDKNDAAVELAKLSLWLVTLAKDLPFTFLDHGLRHGDSLVGLGFDEIRAFHWKPKKQEELFSRAIDDALLEAIALRKRIETLAQSDDDLDAREKERLYEDAHDALDRVRLVGDVLVGAFFAHDKDKEREAERKRRLDIVSTWLGSEEPPPAELLAMRAEIRARVPVFHWMVEFPEVFDQARVDPLVALAEPKS